MGSSLIIPDTEQTQRLRKLQSQRRKAKRSHCRGNRREIGKMTSKKIKTLAEQVRELESVNLPDTVAEQLRKLKLDSASEALRQMAEMSSAQSYSSSIAAELAQQESVASRVAAQTHECFRASEEFQKQYSAIQKMIEESQSGLAKAAEFARAQAAISDQALKVAAITFPHFEIPAFPKLVFPEVPRIDFNGFTKEVHAGAVRMADCGWTIASWMPINLSQFANSTEQEIDEYFLQQYSGNESFEGRLKVTSEELLSSAELKKWNALLQEVFQCIQEGKHIICVPALVSVIDGFFTEHLIKALSLSQRHVKPNKALEKAKWHEDDTVDGLVWSSVVVFLNRMFADAPFDQPRPSFINRHWILHGRSETEWKQVDALKLVNALATFHWVSV
jgi:hypothetical protein